MKGKFLLICAIAPVMLAGCGGGGDSSGTSGNVAGTGDSVSENNTVPETKSFAGSPAMQRFYSEAHSQTLSATNSGDTYTLEIGYKPNSGTSSFNGMTAHSAKQSVSVKQNGTLLGSTIADM